MGAFFSRLVAILTKVFTWLLPALPAIFNAGKEVAKFTLTRGSILTTFVTVGVSAVIVLYNELDNYSTAIVDNLGKVEVYLQDLLSSLEISSLTQNILYYSSMDVLTDGIVIFISVFFGVILFLFITMLVGISTLAISVLASKMWCKIYDKVSKNINIEFS